MKGFWIITISCFFSLVLSAQDRECNLQLFGKITDEHDGSALAFSTISVISQNRGVAADENGFYQIEGLCPQSYQFVISHIGCEPDTVLVDLKQSEEINFQLEHHWEELQAVEVSDRQMDDLNAGSRALSKESFYENSGKQLAEILTEINGVQSLQTGSNVSKPMISGLTNNRVHIINHGVQHQSQSWGDEHAPEIDPFTASNYEVVKGAGALKYSGGALGGLVIASPKKLPQTVGLEGELNTLYATNNRMGNGSLMLEGRAAFIPKLSFRVQGSLKRSGNVKTPNYYQKNSGVSEHNGSMNLGYFDDKWSANFYYSRFNSEVGIFRGAHIGNLTDLQNSIELSEPRPEFREGFSYEINRPYQRIIHELSKAEVNWYTATKGKFNFQFSRQFNIREEFDAETARNSDLAALDIPEFSLSLRSFTANLNWELLHENDGKTEAGVQWIDQRNSVNSFRDFIPDYLANELALYVIQKGRFNQLQWEAALRMEQIDRKVDKLINRQFERFDLNFQNLHAKLGFSYPLSDLINLNWNATYSERAPAVNELFSDGFHHGAASIESGDRSLNKEKSLALNASAEVKYNKWEYQLYAYSQWIEDFIYLKPQGLELTIRGAFPSFQWSNTNALIRGIDQGITYQISDRFRFHNELSLLWGNNRSDDNYLINMPPNRWKSFLTYAVESEQKETLFKASIGNNYVFRQNRFNASEEIAPPPDAYQLLFAHISYRFQIGEKRIMEVGLRANNILNEVYRDYLNRFRFYTDEQGRNFNIRIKINF